MEARAEYLGRVERPRLTVIKDGAAPYSPLPHDILRDTDLSRDARLLYAILQSYWWQTGECFASHETLAADMACSTRMLRKYLDELIRAKKITERAAGARRAKLYAPCSIGTVVPIEASNEKQGSDWDGVNRNFSTGQSEKIDTANTSKSSDSYKKTPEKKTLEEDLPPTVVVAAAAAPTATIDQATILRGLSDGAREILDWHRQCHGRRQPAKLNPESARVLEEAVADLGVERLKESVRYMAGKIPAVPELSKAIRAARTKRTQDEQGAASRPTTPHRNGSARMFPGEASKQTSKWSESKFRVKTLGGPTDGRD